MFLFNKRIVNKTVFNSKTSVSARKTHLLNSSKQLCSKHRHACLILSESPQQKKSSGYKSDGFSYVETIATVALLVILMSLAAPSFGAIMEKTRVSTTSLMVHQTLSVARSSSVSSGKITQICQLESTSPFKCVKSHQRNDSWSQGWLVFIDNNQDNKLDTEDKIVQVFNPNPKTTVIFNQNGRLRFFPDGSSRSAGFYVCARNSSEFRHIKLLYSGRPRTVSSNDRSRLELCKSA